MAKRPDFTSKITGNHYLRADPDPGTTFVRPVYSDGTVGLVASVRTENLRSYTDDAEGAIDEFVGLAVHERSVTDKFGSQRRGVSMPVRDAVRYLQSKDNIDNVRIAYEGAYGWDVKFEYTTQSGKLMDDLFLFGREPN